MENYDVLNDYFEWLYYMVIGEQTNKRASYKKLLMALHNIEFRYSIEYDENRALDGENLRWYFVDDGGDRDILEWEESCTVLEMLIALSYNMEKIMDDPEVDHGVGHWFWIMIDNLDLIGMTDSKINLKYVRQRINSFLDREYEPNGEGGIIKITNCRDDLRDVEIWYQMCWYLDSII